MIKTVSRTRYFDNRITNLRWLELPKWMQYKDVEFRHWVYEIDGEVYPFCTAEFKEAFARAKVWEGLSK